MVRFPVGRASRSAARHRLSRSVAALAITILLALSSCASFTGSSAVTSADDRETEGSVIGWSLFHAIADQWQVKFALQKVGAPWSIENPMVEHLRPGAQAPRYRGKLPVNTIIAPAVPPDVGRGGEYGWRVAPDLGTRELHNGADIGAPHSSEVLAAMEGVVRAVFWDVWGGKRVEVAHAGNMVSTYNHLDKVLVEQGDKLSASQQLGTVGQTGSRVTGPHLHFEMWVDGKAVDPQSFDWVVGDDVIPAPRDRSWDPPVIASGGLGDESSIDPGKTCPSDDPELCGPPGPTSPDDCPAAAVAGAGTDCPGPQWPDLSSVQCIAISPGVIDCVPVPGTEPGAEDCPAAPVAGARTDCPATPPDLSDLQQCQPTELGTIDCVPFGPVPGPEDCPAAAVAGARTDCPGPQWPDLSSVQCIAISPGVIDCVPVPGTEPGAEDCPAAAVAGARTDCPGPQWPDLSSAQCIAISPGVIDCVPVPGTEPGAEDCPPASVPGARTDCPPAPPGRPDPAGPGGDLAAPDAEGEVAPPLPPRAIRPSWSPNDLRRVPREVLRDRRAEFRPLQ